MTGPTLREHAQEIAAALPPLREDQVRRLSEVLHGHGPTPAQGAAAGGIALLAEDERDHAT